MPSVLPTTINPVTTISELEGQLHRQMMDAVRQSSTFKVQWGLSDANGVYSPVQAPLLGGYSGTQPQSARDATEAKLLSEIARLQTENGQLRKALKNPDLPVATSVRQFIETVNVEDIAGRTSPPFNEMALSYAITGRPYMGNHTHTIAMRSGKDVVVRVVGVIVREEDASTKYSSAKPYATYMVPTSAMVEGDALEAIADLVSHVVAERVLKQMEREK